MRLQGTLAAIYDPYKAKFGYGWHSNFRSLLLQLSNSLTRKELQELKSLCGDVVPRDKLETTTTDSNFLRL